MADKVTNQAAIDAATAAEALRPQQLAAAQAAINAAQAKLATLGSLDISKNQVANATAAGTLGSQIAAKAAAKGLVTSDIANQLAQAATQNTSALGSATQNVADIGTAQDQLNTAQNLATQFGTAVSIPAPIYSKTSSTDSQNAFDKFKAALVAEGLGDLADSMIDLIKSENAPTTSEGFYLALTQTPTYQKRFGDTNSARIKNGLQPLSEGEIMKLESGYKQIMESYGLPKGFYDNPDDYKTFIGNDLSASELADRIQAAQSAVQLTDPILRQQLKDYYGLDTAATTAYLLDPTKGEQILNQLASKNTAVIAAANAGYDTGAAQIAQSLGGGELSYAKQATAFAQSKELGSDVGLLANIYGGKYNTAQGMQETFSGQGAMAAAAERQRLSGLETSAFSGSGGVNKGTLGVEQTGIL